MRESYNSHDKKKQAGRANARRWLRCAVALP